MGVDWRIVCELALFLQVQFEIRVLLIHGFSVLDMNCVNGYTFIVKGNGDWGAGEKLRSSRIL